MSSIATRMREIAAEPARGLDILALDIASNTGFARGRFGEPPRCGSIRFASEGASANAIFAGAFDWMVDYTKENDVPDILILEALLPFSAAAFKKRKTNKSTNDILAGLHGVIRAVAYKRRIFDIRTVAASDVRRHFLDMNAVKREDAKRLVVRKCRAPTNPATRGSEPPRSHHRGAPSRRALRS